MKIVKYLLMLIVTAMWFGILSITAKSYFSLYSIIITSIYLLLIYVIWPIGTKHSDYAANRFFIALGIGLFLLVAEIVVNDQCPSVPLFSTHQIVGRGLILLAVCKFLGKIPTALLVGSFGVMMIYRGWFLQPEQLVWRKLRKPEL